MYLLIIKVILCYKTVFQDHENVFSDNKSIFHAHSVFYYQEICHCNTVFFYLLQIK